jgi:hypothetical protein
MHWFEVDKKGLAALMERRGKKFILFELLQNAWDEKSAHVSVELEKLPGRPAARIVVTDDNPDGFADLSHAFTLFAASKKRADPEKRGRFNLGEKLVLSLCERATISTTNGSIVFDHDGRHAKRQSTTKGSSFDGVFKCTAEEFEEIIDAAITVLPPNGVKTTFNKATLPVRKPIIELDAVLPTEISNSEGVLVRSSRKTRIRVYEPRPGEAPSLYEMGIPVVGTEDKYSYDIGQKTPVSFERENVPPAYLRTLRTLVVNALAEQLTEADANEPWVRDALGDDRCTDEAARRLVELRFGEKAVISDPSDPEANSRAYRAGYTIIHGRHLSAREWNVVKRAEAVQPAGVVTPSPKPFSPDGTPLKEMPVSSWSPAMRAFAHYATDVFAQLVGGRLSIHLTNDFDWPFRAAYGKGDLFVNVVRVGRAWFERLGSEDMNGLLIHEFGHHYAPDHLSDAYHGALCRLGASLTRLALEKPGLFEDANLRAASVAKPSRVAP